MARSWRVLPRTAKGEKAANADGSNPNPDPDPDPDPNPKLLPKPGPNPYHYPYPDPEPKPNPNPNQALAAQEAESLRQLQLLRAQLLARTSALATLRNAYYVEVLLVISSS